jgi:hypothetical protein
MPADAIPSRKLGLAVLRSGFATVVMAAMSRDLVLAGTVFFFSPRVRVAYYDAVGHNADLL